MAWTEKQLAQAEVPAAVASIYAGPATGIAIIKQVIISNHEATAGTFSLWHDDDGTTYDDTTNLAEGVPIDANSMVVLDVWWPIDTAGNIAADADAANKLTITLYGVNGIS